MMMMWGLISSDVRHLYQNMHAHYMYGLIYEIQRFACYLRAVNSFSLLLPGVLCALRVIVGLVFETNMEPKLLSVVKLFNGGRMCFAVLKRCINIYIYLALCTLDHRAYC